MTKETKVLAHRQVPKNKGFFALKSRYAYGEGERGFENAHGVALLDGEDVGRG